MSFYLHLKGSMDRLSIRSKTLMTMILMIIQMILITKEGNYQRIFSGITVFPPSKKLREGIFFLSFIFRSKVVNYYFRERNREHAKRSRVRKKFLLESLQQSVRALQEENDKLRLAIKSNLKGEADALLASCSLNGGPSIIASNPAEATKQLYDPDYSLVKALQTAQQNFVISDPSLPDNPIVYASQGFLALTGYKLDQVLGRNCRFLQGPETDPAAVDRIRKGIERGDDTTVVLLNYRCDGSTFWNQFFIAALRDGDGNVVNYLGVQCKVSEEYARAFLKNELYGDNNTKRL